MTIYVFNNKNYLIYLLFLFTISIDCYDIQAGKRLSGFSVRLTVKADSEDECKLRCDTASFPGPCTAFSFGSV